MDNFNPYAAPQQTENYNQFSETVDPQLALGRNWQRVCHGANRSATGIVWMTVSFIAIAIVMLICLATKSEDLLLLLLPTPITIFIGYIMYLVGISRMREVYPSTGASGLLNTAFICMLIGLLLPIFGNLMTNINSSELRMIGALVQFFGNILSFIGSLTLLLGIGRIGKALNDASIVRHANLALFCLIGIVVVAILLMVLALVSFTRLNQAALFADADGMSEMSEMILLLILLIFFGGLGIAYHLFQYLALKKLAAYRYQKSSSSTSTMDWSQLPQ